MTGKEKAAVLFVALGRAAWGGITDRLTRRELKALRLAVKRTRYGLGEEYAVLQEVEQYGLRRGIWPKPKTPVHRMDINVDINVNDSVRAQDVRQTANERPDEVAKLIGQWLGGEDGKL